MKSQLAVLGGTPTLSQPSKRTYQWPAFTLQDYFAAQKAIFRIARGSIRDIPLLESEFAVYLNTDYALAQCNGSSAVFSALFGFGIAPGDEVIVPSATFWASALPVLHWGAVPVFADIEKSTGGLDPEDVAAKITDRTKAIVVVHLWGMPASMDSLLGLAKKHNLKVLEDASHAHGAVYHGKKIGTLADAAVFSLQSSKLLPTGEGGLLVTRDKDIFEKAVALGRYENIDSNSTYKDYAHTGLGFKFRISSINAAIARSQLKRLDKMNKKRKEACEYLSERLERLGFDALKAPDGIERVYYEFNLRCTKWNRETLVKALQAEGVPVTIPEYPLIHRTPLILNGEWRKLARISSDYVYPFDLNLPHTEKVLNELIQLPVFHSASLRTLNKIAEAFEKVIAGFDQAQAAMNQSSVKSGSVDAKVCTKTFALIGCGNVSQLHFEAIKSIGGELTAALDCKQKVKNSPAKYFKKARFFTDRKKFFEFIHNKVKYVVICTPDYLHKEFIIEALTRGFDVICEKPITMRPQDLELLEKTEKITGRKIWGILQGRWAPQVKMLKQRAESEPIVGVVKCTHFAPRDRSYADTWRGNPEQAGGLIMDIGIHALDAMQWCFGDCLKREIFEVNERSMKANLEFEKAKVSWFLSIGELSQVSDKDWVAERSFELEGEKFDLTEIFTNLHADLYRDTLSGKGLRIADLRGSLELAYHLQDDIARRGIINQHGHLWGMPAECV